MVSSTVTTRPFLVVQHGIGDRHRHQFAVMPGVQRLADPVTPGPHQGERERPPQRRTAVTRRHVPEHGYRRPRQLRGAKDLRTLG